MKFVIVSAVAALGLGGVSPVMAQEAEAPPTGPVEIIRADDAGLTCAAMADEAARLSEAMGGEPDGGLFGRLGGVARVGASMLIPGAGLVLAGADVVTASGRERKAAEAGAVRHRWYYLNGLYAGRDCMSGADAAGASRPSPADAAPAPDED
jgi:hypothetical protein